MKMTKNQKMEYQFFAKFRLMKTKIKKLSISGNHVAKLPGRRRHDRDREIHAAPNRTGRRRPILANSAKQRPQLHLHQAYKHFS